MANCGEVTLTTHRLIEERNYGNNITTVTLPEVCSCVIARRAHTLWLRLAALSVLIGVALIFRFARCDPMFVAQCERWSNSTSEYIGRASPSTDPQPTVEPKPKRPSSHRPHRPSSAASTTHVTGFVLRHAGQLSPVRAGLMVTALRSFFRYLRHRGAIATDLAGCFPTVPTGRFPRFRGFCRLPRWNVFWSAAIERPPLAGGTVSSCCCSPGSAYAPAKLLG